MDQRARDSHPLHLSARELMRVAVTETLQLDPCEPFACGRARIGFARKQQRQLYVLENGQRIQQLKRLKDEADLCASKLRQFGVLQGRSWHAVEQHLAGSRKVHRARQIQQRRFTATASSHQRHKFAARYFQRKPIERPHALAVRQIVLGNVLEGEDGHS